MKKLAILFFIFGLFVTGNLFAQLKIGYVDSNTIMKQIPDAQDAQKVLDATIQEWKTELSKKQRTLKSKKKDFEDKKLILSSLKKSEFKKEINALEREISNYRERKFGVNGELFKKQKELMKPIENKVFNVIKELKKIIKSYKIIITKSTVPVTTGDEIEKILSKKNSKKKKIKK